MKIFPFLHPHKNIGAMSYRIDKMAYTTDIHALPDECKDQLHGLDLWILECNNPEPKNNGHNDLQKALRWIDEVKPARTILTHLATSMDYDHISAQLPDSVELAFDGLTVEL